jgi:hypothetical protein
MTVVYLVNKCAGMHSLRRTAVIEIFENKQDLRLAHSFYT